MPTNAATQPTPARHLASLFPPARNLPDYAVERWQRQEARRAANDNGARARKLGGAR